MKATSTSFVSLGAAASARVLHVRDRKTGEEWAAKVLINLDADSRHRFIRKVKQAWRYRRLRHVVSTSSLDATTVGRLAPPPRGEDQKLAALAAWGALH